ncbi:PAS domain-containing protein [Desulfuromonas sp. TF]|uniref:PAS domain-containing protein n=1 Tax=Desulfuromonas sp. TF TaxID=1232410 RepID=UPI0004137BFB|nr:PAS domain-containing protein [Desulfuromonas sp. TF]
MGVDKDKSVSTDAAELRRQAEERMGASTPKVHPPRTEAATQGLVHELEVHQVELEMQNDELRQARDDAEKALEKYADLYDFAPVGYFTLDRDGIIGAANITGATLLGIERSRLIGRRFGLFVAAEARPAFTDFLGKVFTNPSKEACEVPLLSEGERSLFVQIEAVAGASGHECRVAIIDISARRQLEEGLEVLHTELEAFNYSISHDLRIPLTVINATARWSRNCAATKSMRRAEDVSRKYMKAPCA